MHERALLIAAEEGYQHDIVETDSEHNTDEGEEYVSMEDWFEQRLECRLREAGSPVWPLVAATTEKMLGLSIKA